MIKQGYGILTDEFFVLSARRLNASYALVLNRLMHPQIVVMLCFGHITWSHAQQEKHHRYALLPKTPPTPLLQQCSDVHTVDQPFYGVMQTPVSA